jgi:hypothetical protein
MKEVSRRQFVGGILAATTASVAIPQTNTASERAQPDVTKTVAPNTPATESIDFRYAPQNFQTAICFPDDAKKSLVGQLGDLRYGFSKDLLVGMEDFATICTFSMAGMQKEQVAKQWLEKSGVPIVHTLISHPKAQLELIAFASQTADEGRVDNVLMKITPTGSSVAASGRVHIRTCDHFEFKESNGFLTLRNAATSKDFLVARKLGKGNSKHVWWEDGGFTIYLEPGTASSAAPLQYFLRLPQDGQSADTLLKGFDNPEALLENERTRWQNTKWFEDLNWDYPARHGEFLTACARNIQQAREIRDGRRVFQVGPTVYRGLWIVDGNFLLEAARYLGYDKEADEGLRAEWAKQVPTGQVIAAVPGEHWKDTAIAMFTLVRQCELKNDWQDFRDLEPNVAKAVDFLISVRDKARNGDSINGHYGILAPGFADGGIDGVRSEFTNTVWTLAALLAVSNAAKRLQMKSLDRAANFYAELSSAFEQAARAEMTQHPGGFRFLPMLAKDDPLNHIPDEWSRPRPQSSQWALSQAIFPGEVFDKSDPIVQGHIALMQSSTREGIPAETGWLRHECVWNYSASFAAHVYLWAGLYDWARSTFAGFLNHASPLYCWREEQPLQDALLGQDWGDMPHNWASAECVRFLRHMLVLEDGSKLRLLQGFAAQKESIEHRYELENSPTRFGRINLTCEPSGRTAYQVNFEMTPGFLAPECVELPLKIAGATFASIEKAKSSATSQIVSIEPTARRWTAIYR